MKRLLLTGASGFLGAAVRQALKGTSFMVAGRTKVEGADFFEADLSNPGFTSRLPECSALIHMAAEARLDECERDPEKARKVNVEATRELAHWSFKLGIPMVFTSTDLVFGGHKAPYAEGASPDPISEYGRQKAETEREVMKASPLARVLRLSLLYDVERPNFLSKALKDLASGQPVNCYVDEWRTPVWVESAARAVLLALEVPPGIYHAGGAKRMSRFDMVEKAAKARGLNTNLVRSVSRMTHPLGRHRPEDVSLTSAKLLDLGWRAAPYDRLIQ
ncbi:MAG: NAD(P)-dependent oxidoreductase [Planctomycetota bacterium]